jgi:tetratricopeptide (TPR) repeat protein
MKKKFTIIIVLAVVSTAFLFALPKVVVKDEGKKSPLKSAANRDAPQKANDPASTINSNESHAIKLTAEQQSKVDGLKKQLAGAKDKALIIKTLAQISTVFAGVNRLDSTAAYVEKIALLDPNQQTWLQAGDAYTQAANLSLRQESGETLAAKAREAYQKVLGMNPHNLRAKTNMAMTWVSSQTPMQGILLLREVLEEEPNYEPALMSLGMLSMQSSQFDKAVGRFRQVLKIDSKNTIAQFYLGVCLIETKETTEAKKVLEDLLTKEKDPAIQQEAKKALENLK